MIVNNRKTDMTIHRESSKRVSINPTINSSTRGLLPLPY